MEVSCPRKRVGYWMTEKKIRRLNFDFFETVCRNAGIDLVKLDFDRPLEDQGPFMVILHKLTDQLARTQDGSAEAIRQIEKFQKYVYSHPEVIVIDPIENVMRLLDRHQQYQYVKDCDVVETNYHYFIPSFVELTTSNVDDYKRLLKENDIQYPFVCKPSLSHCHGSNISHTAAEQMAIIFDEKSLVDIETPCVAQTFVNHNACLFKIFIVGRRHFVIQRPSIKNFYEKSEETIFFNSNDVSKSYSSSALNKLDDQDLLNHPIIEPDFMKMENFVDGIQRKFGLDLLGIDVIIENDTGRYAVIDINAFPGYDGVSEFFDVLLELIEDKLVLSSQKNTSLTTTMTTRPHLSNGSAYGLVELRNQAKKSTTSSSFSSSSSSSTAAPLQENALKTNVSSGKEKESPSFLPFKNWYIYDRTRLTTTTPPSALAAAGIARNGDAPNSSECVLLPRNGFHSH